MKNFLQLFLIFVMICFFIIGIFIIHKFFIDSKRDIGRIVYWNMPTERICFYYNDEQWMIIDCKDIYETPDVNGAEEFITEKDIIYTKFDCDHDWEIIESKLVFRSKYPQTYSSVLRHIQTNFEYTGYIYYLFAEGTIFYSIYAEPATLKICNLCDKNIDKISDWTAKYYKQQWHFFNIGIKHWKEKERKIALKWQK